MASTSPVCRQARPPVLLLLEGGNGRLRRLFPDPRPNQTPDTKRLPVEAQEVDVFLKNKSLLAIMQIFRNFIQKILILMDYLN